MTRIAFLAAIAVVASAGVAQAEDEVIRESDKIVYKAKTELNFSGTDVEGNTIKPEAPMVVVKQKSSFANMIEHRKSFHSELEQSAEE